MRIVFGWYSFKIKSFTPQELGIKNDGSNDIQIEVRQKCFHLFWIPTFGLGKVYAFRRNGQLYELPVQHIQLVQQVYTPKTPWYTYLLPILAIVIGGIYYIQNEIESYQWEKESKNSFASKNIQLDSSLSNLRTDNYISLSPNNACIKVVAVHNSMIRYIGSVTEIYNFEDYPYKIINFFNDKRYPFDTLECSTSMLKKAIITEYDNQYDDSKGIDLLHTGVRYHIKDIYYLKGPQLNGLQSSRFYYPDFTFNIINTGTWVKLISIKNISNEVVLSNSLPLMIVTSTDNYNKRQTTTLKGSIKQLNKPFEALLVFEDSLKSQYTYRFMGQDMDWTIEKMEK